MNAIEVRDVRKLYRRYGRRKSFGTLKSAVLSGNPFAQLRTGDVFEALKGVSVAIEDGEFVVLVGPSGCGKSTLLRMIAGLEEITSGEIEIGERVVNDLPPKERDIAMVFQNYALYPHMTVAQNMGFSLKLKGVPKPEIKAKVDRAAQILGLEKLLDRQPRQLSGGQRQRVAMGRAIVRDPQVFLFDEPLSNLDAKLRVQMRSEIKELHQRLKTTTIYVTHDQVEAMTMADKIVVMRDGIIEQMGSPLSLTVARSFLSTVGVGVLLILMGCVKPFRGTDGRPRPWPAWLRYSAFAVGGFTILAALLGYIGLAVFVSVQIVVTGALLLTAYIGFLTARAVGAEGGFAETGLGRRLTERHGLRETTLDPANRTLVKVTMEETAAADDMFRVLMGEKVEPRREFIEKHALEVKNLDV